MPTYEYVCKACGHELELFQSMTDAPKRKCPKCGKNSLERKIGTGAAVLFKGSGFYQTDYRSESYKKAADSDKKPDSAKAESKPESKPESRPEPTKAKAEPEKKPKKAGKGKDS